jgi:hypothetical protein
MSSDDLMEYNWVFWGCGILTRGSLRAKNKGDRLRPTLRLFRSSCRVAHPTAQFNPSGTQRLKRLPQILREKSREITLSKLQRKCWAPALDCHLLTIPVSWDTTTWPVPQAARSPSLGIPRACLCKAPNRGVDTADGQISQTAGEARLRRTGGL